MGILGFLYMLNCAICIVAYMPQLWKLVHDKTDSASVSMPSWLIWIYTGAVGLAYAVVVNGDPLLILSAGSNMLLCAAVVGMLFFNRYIKSKMSKGAETSLYEMVQTRRRAARIPRFTATSDIPQPHVIDMHTDSFFNSDTRH